MADSIVVKVNMYEKPVELMADDEKRKHFNIPLNVSVSEYMKQLDNTPFDDNLENRGYYQDD